MLQKETSNTRSSKSATTSSGLDTSIQFVKGVGPRLASILGARGIRTVGELLTFFPRSYQDRSQLSQVEDLEDGQSASLKLEVLSARQVPLRSRRFRKLLEAQCRDESGVIALKWFRAPPYLINKLKPGTRLYATGKIKKLLARAEMIHPELSWDDAKQSTQHVGRIVPIYTEIEGVTTRTLRTILWNALQQYASHLADDLPPSLLEQHQLPNLKQAVQQIHFPAIIEDASVVEKLKEFESPAQHRLIYEEFYKFEYFVLRKKLAATREKAVAFDLDGSTQAADDLKKAFPFELTTGQTRALAEILEDLHEPHPMNRLIQGDVGSGKTAVALLSAGAVIAQGSQVALMAPTEILAEQHFKTAIQHLGDRISIALFTGKTPQKEKDQLIGKLMAGQPMFVIGTHALIEDPVQFKTLDYVLIDEQHRFGVDQRRILRDKGARNGGHPHFLVLTATPIPRTLSLTVYGDLAVSSIRELPPGRSPVKTEVCLPQQHRRAYEKIGAELKAGRQVYFINPLVQESEAEGFTHLKAAEEQAKKLQKEVFPEYKVELLHGRMKADEKSAVMSRFKNGKTHILVSTTVVEVGVDVPNATVIVIQNAERFGLSQLHQLRGRVGRGKHESYCFLMAGSQQLKESTEERLRVLEQTTDGFKIAEADLRLRGPGEFLGTRQSGALPFKMADLVRDQRWLLQARDDVIDLMKIDPYLRLQQHQPLRKFFERDGRLQFDRLQTS